MRDKIVSWSSSLIQKRSRGLAFSQRWLLLSLTICLTILGQTVVRSSAVSEPLFASEPVVWSSSGWRVIESTEQKLVIDVRVPTAQWYEYTESDGWYELPGFNKPSLLAGRSFRSLVIPVAIPPLGDVQISAQIAHPYLLDRKFDQLHQHDFSPLFETEPRWPDMTPRALSERDVRFADPQGFVQASDPGWGRNLRMIHLEIYGVRPDANGNLLSCGNIRITVDFPRSEGGVDKKSAFDPIQKRQVANPDQVSKWRSQLPRALGRKTGDSFATATSPWLKLEITERGFYQIGIDDLRDLGIDPEVVDLNQLRLFTGPGKEVPPDSTLDALPAWMEQVALLIEDDNSGQWREETKVYFLASGPDGWLQDMGLPPDAGGDYRYYQHPYANQRIYWLCWGGDFSTPPKRMATQLASPTGSSLTEIALNRIHFEKNSSIYDHDIREEGVPWEKFFLAELTSRGINVRLDLEGFHPGTAAHFRACLWGDSWNGTIDMSDHYATVTLMEDGVEGPVVGSAEWDNLNHAVIEGDIAGDLASTWLKIKTPPREISPGISLSDDSNVAWIELDYYRSLDATGDSLDFFVSPSVAGGDGLRITSLTQADDWILIDGTNMYDAFILEPDLVSAEGTLTAEFGLEPQSIDSHITLMRKSNAASPSNIKIRQWDGPRLAEITEGVDYLVVSADQLLSEAARLAAHRRTNFFGPTGDSLQPGSVILVSTSDIYDEFSWGMVDPTAIRNCAKFAYRNWRGGELEPRLSNMVLIGNALYDARGYRTGEPEGYLPPYLEYLWYARLHSSAKTVYAADEWFSTLDEPGDAVPDIAIGRLPVRTIPEAAGVINKLIDYEISPPPGDWKTKLVIAADDLCQGTEIDRLYQHTEQANTLCMEHTPKDADLDRVYLYEYGTECIYSRKPAATNHLLTTLSDGGLIFDFVGHGSDVQLADERLLETSTLGSLENDGKPFLMITASCEVGRFIQDGDGFALNAIRMPERGALGVIAASAPAGAGPNARMNNMLLDHMFADSTVTKPIAIGTAFWNMKTNSLPGWQGNNRRYNLFGDPGSRFSVPARRIEMNLKDAVTSVALDDTLTRGSALVLTGAVVDHDGETDLSFTGQAEVFISDSDLINQFIYRSGLTVIEGDYNLDGANILTMTTDVIDGLFTIPYFVPQTLLRGKRGAANIRAFARSDQNDGLEACGTLSDLFISTDPAPITDNTPPDITLAWEVPGEVVAAGSKLEASLFDSSGIYVAALTPARAVQVMIVDQDDKIILTEDISAAVIFNNDYRSAAASYVLPGWLPKRTHLSLSLSASDNVGQRSSGSIDFSIEGESVSGRQVLEQVFLMPNPIETEGHFMFELVQSADIKVDIYTSSGRKIAEIESPEMNQTDAREVGLRWDGRDDDGDQIANGLYFYRVTATGPDGSREELIDRLVVFR